MTTTSFLLAPEPFWFIVNNAGEAAGGAKMYTRRSLNKVQDKAVFEDAGGTIPWTNPIIFDLNGVQGPFYWEIDSANPEETYYIFVNDADGNLIWDIDDFSPTGSGGGGGDVTTYISIVNYIANNQFIDHIDDTASPIGAGNLVIAPSNHKGFTPALINPVIGTYGVVGPDIRFVKNTTANTDQITFPLFPLATAPLTGDVTPVDYLRYQCTTTNPGETYKAFQFPITQKIKNLSNQIMTFKVWAAVTALPVTLTAYVRQYFGSGTAASAEVRTSIGTMALTTTWTSFFLSFTVPDVAGKSIGNANQQTDDDALYIQLEMPLNVACDVLFIKPALYLGDIQPNLEFEDYDQINSINSTPRTGDIRTSLSSAAPQGWVAMNDGSIGEVGSGATNRANKDTFQLYSTIYTGVSDTYAPVSGGRTAPGNTMTTAIADFVAGKTLTLPRNLGMALAGAGNGSGFTARALGEFTTSETTTLVVANLPEHTHNPLAGASGFFENQAGGGAVAGSGFLLSRATTGGVTGFTAPTGVSVIQPTSFFNVFIKL